MRSRVAFGSAIIAATVSGCWSHVEEYCPSCPTVEHSQVAVRSPAAGVRIEVVLVHGAFGFGEEWIPIVAKLRASPDVSFFAWSWHGLNPLADLPRDAWDLTAQLQAQVDQLPPSVSEVLVFAHSAGAVLANLAARRLRVPIGRHVTVALLDPALDSLLTFWPALADPASYPPVPPRVSMTAYFAREAPRRAGSPLRPDPARATDLNHEYLGDVGHDPLVARVVLPLLEARRRQEPSL